MLVRREELLQTPSHLLPNLGPVRKGLASPMMTAARQVPSLMTSSRERPLIASLTWDNLLPLRTFDFLYTHTHTQLSWRPLCSQRVLSPTVQSSSQMVPPRTGESSCGQATVQCQLHVTFRFLHNFNSQFTFYFSPFPRLCPSEKNVFSYSLLKI